MPNNILLRPFKANKLSNDKYVNHYFPKEIQILSLTYDYGVSDK